MDFLLTYPGFKKKAFTTSYDDGVVQDIRLIEILRKYGIKGTFNLNSGLSGVEKFREDIYKNQIDCSRLVLKDYVNLYSGFEVASHTSNHPFLETLSKKEQKEEFEKDIAALSDMFSQNVRGAAYPYGTYNADTLEVERELGIQYSRTTRSTYSFSRPYNFLLWHPTIHHTDPKLNETLERFFKDETTELGLFYLWGHAYEFAINDNFSVMEETCQKVKNHEEEIYLATNIELVDYIKAAELVYYKKREEGFLINPSNRDIYVIVKDTGEKVVLKPHERRKYE